MAFPELDQVTASQEEQLMALAARLDGLARGDVHGEVAAALAAGASGQEGEDEQATLVRRLTALRLQIYGVAQKVDEQPDSPRPIADEISDDFEQHRRRLLVEVHDRHSGDLDVFGDLPEADLLRYLTGPQQDALTSIRQMLDAIDRKRHQGYA